MNAYALRRYARRAVSGLIGGDAPRLHRIPFGPNRGRLIYCSPTISPRMYFGLDERRLVSLVRENVRSDDVVYDVGAHVGYTALLFAKRARHVHAFELVPSVAQEFLRRTIQANALSNVTIHQVGLFDDDRIVELPVSKTMMASLDFIRNGVHRERCHLVTLDAYAVEQGLPPPSLIKIDVEGAEVHCLRGSFDLLRRQRPVLIVEFHSWDLFEAGTTLLQPLGYQPVGLPSPQTGMATDRPPKFHQSVLYLPEGRSHAASERAADDLT